MPESVQMTPASMQEFIQGIYRFIDGFQSLRDRSEKIDAIFQSYCYIHRNFHWILSGAMDRFAWTLVDHVRTTYENPHVYSHPEMVRICELLTERLHAYLVIGEPDAEVEANPQEGGRREGEGAEGCIG